MSDLEQLEIGQRKASALDGEIDAENELSDDQASELVVLPPLREEIADMLNTMAMAGAFIMPTIPKHYSPENNLKIADALIKLADRYGYDLRAAFLGEHSIILLWVGVAYTVGMPAGACFMDYKAIKLQQAKAQQTEQASQPAQKYNYDDAVNAVVTGV